MRLFRSDGFSLLELMVAGVILAITILGLALFMSRSQGFVMAASDQRAALYLAEQMIEQQFAQLRSPVSPSDSLTRQASFMSIANVCVYTAAHTADCGDFSGTQWHSSPAETLSGTASAGWTLNKTANPLRFSRFTCIQWVNDSTFAHGTDGTPAADCPCTNAGAATNTKRVCVKVTQIDPSGNAVPAVSPVVLRSVLSSPP